MLLFRLPQFTNGWPDKFLLPATPGEYNVCAAKSSAGPFTRVLPSVTVTIFARESRMRAAAAAAAAFSLIESCAHSLTQRALPPRATPSTSARHRTRRCLPFN